MIASLPMYLRPEVVDAHDRYWKLIARELHERGIDHPAALSHDADEVAMWSRSDLVLGQTCGMPFRNGLHRHVHLVGTPDYGLADTPAGYSRSVFVVRTTDTRRTVSEFAEALFAYNQHHSQSGYSSPYHHVRALGFWFDRRFRSGQHLASARAVADGAADIAAIDEVSWRLITTYESFAAQLRVIDRTAPVPGLPYITADAGLATPVFESVSVAIDRLEEPDRAVLGLKGVVAIAKAVYLGVENPPAAVTAALER